MDGLIGEDRDFFRDFVPSEQDGFFGGMHYGLGLGPTLCMLSARHSQKAVVYLVERAKSVIWLTCFTYDVPATTGWALKVKLLRPVEGAEYDAQPTGGGAGPAPPTSTPSQPRLLQLIPG